MALTLTLDENSSITTELSWNIGAEETLGYSTNYSGWEGDVANASINNSNASPTCNFSGQAIKSLSQHVAVCGMEADETSGLSVVFESAPDGHTMDITGIHLDGCANEIVIDYANASPGNYEGYLRWYNKIVF